MTGMKEVEAAIESWCERNAVALPGGWAENKNKKKEQRAAYLVAQVKSWFSVALQEDDPRLEYRLFNAQTDITGLPFWSLPIFPVNEKGEIDADLMSWMINTNNPSEAYLAAKKVSLEDLTISSFIASTNDAERREPAQILKAFAETRLGHFRAYFKATSSASQNIREIDHITIVVNDGIYDIAKRFGADVQEETSQGVLVIRTSYGIEIIQPIKGHPKSQELVSFLEKRGNPTAVYSVTLETKEIEKTLASVNQSTLLALVTDETPRLNSSGDKTAFIHPRATQSRTLVELIERRSSALSSAHFSLCSTHNSLTKEGVADKFQIRGVTYAVDDPKIADINKLGEPMTIALQSGQNVTFTIRGPTISQKLRQYLARALPEALSRSSFPYKADLNNNITIVLADKYDFLAGDHRENSLIILNASDLEAMIAQGENAAYIAELTVSLLSEELAHERGAKGDVATEEKLANVSARKTIASVSSLELDQYISFIERYEENFQNQKGYIRYLKRYHSVTRLMNRVASPLRKRAVREMFTRASSFPLRDVPLEMEERFLDFLKGVFIEGVFVTLEEIRSQMPDELAEEIPEDSMEFILEDLSYAGYVAKLTIDEKEGYHLLDLGEIANESPLGQQIWGTRFFPYTQRGILDVQRSGHWTFLPRNVRNYYLKDSYLKNLGLEEQAAVDLFIEAYVRMARTLTEKQRESAPEALREKYEDKFIDEFLSEANLRALWKTRKRLLDSFPNPGELPAGVRELTEEKFIETFHNLRANPEAVKAAFSKLNEAFETLRQEMPKVKTRKERNELVQNLEQAMRGSIADLLGIQYAGSALPQGVDVSAFSYNSMIHFYAEIFAIVYEPAYAGKPTFVVYYVAERLRQQVFGLTDFYKQEKDRSNRAALGIFPKFYNSFATVLGWDIPEATMGETLKGTLAGAYTEGLQLDTQVLFETYVEKGKTLPIVKEVWDKYKENFSGAELLRHLATLLFMYGSLSKLSLICAAVNAMDLGDPRFQKEAQDQGFNEAGWLVDKIGDVIVRGFQGNHINEFFEMTASAYLEFEIKKKEKGWKEKPAKPSERIDDAERPKIILLTDNAGEAVFDMLLVKYLLGLGFNVVIASRDVPVINDMTEKDMAALVEEMKLAGYFGEYDGARLKVISSGSKIFGTSVKDIELGSAFLREYSDKNTIYVIAKGQGNAESLWQGEWSKPFVHILTSKEPEKVEEFVMVPKHSALLLVNVPAQEKIAEEEGDVLTETVSLKDRPDIISALNAAGKNVMIIHEENIYIYLGEFGENLADEFINCFEGDNIILDASKGPIYLGKARIGSGSYLMAENGDVRVRGGARLGKDCVIKDSAIVSAAIENGEIVTRRTIDVDREGNTRRFRRTAVKSFISPEGVAKMKTEPLSINKALRKKLEGSGVLITGDPSTIYIDDDVEIAPGVTIGPNVILIGKTEIKKGAKIGPYVCLITSKVMEGVELSRLNASGCVFNPGLNIGGIAQLLRNEEIYTYADVPMGSSAVGLIISPALEKGEKGIIGVRVRGKKSRTLSYNLLEGREAPEPLRFAEIRANHLDLFDVLLEQASEAINEARIQLAEIHEDRTIDKLLEEKILGTIKMLLNSSIVDELAFWEVKDLMWQIIRVYAGSPFQILKKEADENALMRIGYLANALDKAQEPDKRLELAIKIAAFSNINIFDRRKAEEGFYSKTNNPVSKFEDILFLVAGGADINLLLSSIHDAGYLAVDESGNIIKRLLETPESERQDKTVVFNINNAGEAAYVLILAREVLKLGYKVVLAANPEPIDDNYDIRDLKELLENPLVSDKGFLGNFLAAGKIKAVSNGSPGAGLYLNKVSREFYEIVKNKDTVMMVSVGYESTRDAFTEILPLDCAYLCWVKRDGVFTQAGLDVELGDAIVAFVEKGGRAVSAAVSPAEIIKPAQGVSLPSNKGWISKPEYLQWLERSKNKIIELAGPQKSLIAYYYAIGGGLVQRPGAGAEDIDIVSPLLATDFTLLIGSDIARGDFGIFKSKVKKNLGFLADVDLDSISFDQGIERIDEDNYAFFTAEFIYLNKLRKVKVYYGMDAKRAHPDELRKGYNVLYSRGNPGLTLEIPKSVMSGLISYLIKDAGFIIMENLPTAKLNFKNFGLVDLGDVSWSGRRLDFYTNIKKAPASASSGDFMWRGIAKRLFVITLAALLLSACSPDPTFAPMLLKDVIVIFGGLMLLTGVGAGTIAFLAIHDKTVNFKSVGIAIVGTALILVSAAILLANYRIPLLEMLPLPQVLFMVAQVLFT